MTMPHNAPVSAPETAPAVKATAPIRFCSLCGGPLPPASAKGGAPRMQHDACREYNARLVQLTKEMAKIKFANKALATKARGDLFAVVNQQWHPSKCLLAPEAPAEALPQA